MNLYHNSNIDCNKKIKINYMIYIIIFFLMNSFIVINIKIVLSLLFINKVILDCQIVYFNNFISIFRVLLSNK